jgi:Protein of unknown function (DUF3738)/Clp amino terminal domain, pathogenicity island component
MFERCNEPARRSLFFSRYEAALLSSLAIEPEHLLLGILKDRDELIAHLVGGSQSVDAIRRLMYGRAGQPGSPLDISVEIPFSKDTKRALEYAAEEANRLLHRHIGSEHLLLGLLRLEAGPACDVLREAGLGLTSVREALVMHVSATSPPPPEIAGMLAAMLPRDVQRAQRSGSVYCMTALDGDHPGRRAATVNSGSGGFGAFSTFSTVGFSTAADRPPDGARPSDGGTHSIGPIWMTATTLGAFALALEDFLGRPIIDDTGITGSWDIELQGQYDNPDALIAALRDQLGLVLTKSLS